LNNFCLSKIIVAPIFWGYFFMKYIVTMKKLTLKLLLILSLSNFAHSQNIAEIQEQKIQEALKEIYRMNYSHSIQLFAEVENSGYFHPLAPLGEISAQWFSDKEIYGYKIGNNMLWKKIEPKLEFYTEKLNEDPDNAESLYFYGICLGLKARLLLEKKDWFGILTCGIKSIHYINKAAKLDENSYDIILAKGVFNYYVGISSAYMKITSWIFNLSGSKEEGLAQIEAAAIEAKYGKYEAHSILIPIYLFIENDYENALKHARIMVNLFPENPYYHSLAADILLNQGKIIEAEPYIKKVEELLPDLKQYAKKEYILKLILLKGEKAFYQNQYEQAEKEFLKFIENYNFELDYSLASALLHLGHIYDLQDNREKAVKYYQMTIELDNRSKACLIARKYLTTPYTK